MRSILQLIRQPLRTLAGILVVALAVSVLSVSVSQTLAAANTAEQLNETFLTVALPTASMSPYAQKWVEELKEEHPGIVETDASHGLASAWIPELTPDNYTQHLDGGTADSTNTYYLPHPRASYSAAMLVITLESWGQPETVTYHEGSSVPLAESASPYVELVGTVEQVIGLQEGYNDPTGFTARLDLYLTDMDEWEELEPELIPGEMYLVYGMDYYDMDWQLRCNMAAVMTWREEPELLDWDLHTLEEVELTDWRAGPDGNFYPVKVKSIKCKIGDLYHGMQGAEAEMFRTVSLTLTDRVTVPEFSDEFVHDENGELVYDKLGRQFLRKLMEHQLTYTDKNGSTVTLTEEEYSARYATPRFLRLETDTEEFLDEEGNVRQRKVLDEQALEEFLASEEGSLWQKMLDNLTVNNNTFPVIGSEELGWVAGFATGKAEVTEGRAFTAEDSAAGAKVCVIAKSLAEANGLTVGDTLDIQFYDYDPIDPYQGYISDDGLNSGIVNPAAYYYRADTTPFAEGGGEYTIVGLYEQRSEWGDPDDDYYSFTPNTVFVPKGSVPAAMDYSSEGMFRTLVIRSDSLYDLQLLTVEDDMDGIFYYYDNGYSAVASTLDDYREAAELLLPIGLVVYAIVIFLFLFLFPGRQGKDLAMMDSFGAGMSRRVGHMAAGCLGIVIPGSAIGTVVGLLLWQRVSVELQAWVETAVSVELDPWSLWAVAAVQVIVVTLLTVILAVPMARRANLMKRK